MARDLEDVTRTLEEQGVESFEKAWNELLESVDRAISEQSVTA